MAGGGIKGGVVHGATDEIGFHAVENRHYVTDIHATILHQLGLDSRKLEIPGRKRLDIDHGKPITEILALNADGRPGGPAASTVSSGRHCASRGGKVHEPAL